MLWTSDRATLPAMPEEPTEVDLEQMAEDWLRMRGEISELRKQNRELKENLRDVLRILGVTSGIPFVQPGMRLLPEQMMDYKAAVERLRQQYFEFPDEAS
jgi:hypothetical protein